MKFRSLGVAAGFRPPFGERTHRPQTSARRWLPCGPFSSCFSLRCSSEPRTSLDLRRSGSEGRATSSRRTHLARTPLVRRRKAPPRRRPEHPFVIAAPPPGAGGPKPRARRPRPSFPRLPAKGDAFPRPRVLFAVRIRVGMIPAPAVPGLSRAALRLRDPEGCCSRRTSAFCAHPEDRPALTSQAIEGGSVRRVTGGLGPHSRVHATTAAPVRRLRPMKPAG